jgi:hypothetical protein
MRLGMNTILTPNKKISSDDIALAESILNSVLPTDFVSFLMETNGGDCEKDTYDYVDIDGEKNSSDVLEFFSLFSKDGFGVVEKTSALRGRGRILATHIVIGRESGGNFILLDTQTKAILLWDHSREDELPRNCYLIGENFTQFFNESLYPFDHNRYVLSSVK